MAFYRLVRRLLGIVIFCSLLAAALSATGSLGKIGTLITPYFPLHSAWLPVGSALGIGLSLLIWLVVAFLFGRIFCSVFCPLGFIEDNLGRIVCRMGFVYRSTSYQEGHPFLRLTFFLIAVLGLSGAYYLTRSLDCLAYIDPLEVFNRAIHLLTLNGTDSTVVTPEMAETGSNATGGLLTLLFFLGVFILLLVDAIVTGRFFCSTICPLGTLFSFLGRFAIFRVMIDKHECVSCRACSSRCANNCIRLRKKVIDHSRCTMCGRCLKGCPKDAISISLGFSHSDTDQNKE